ncbi:DUF3078 domain-containing protein [Mucilaginibacter sp.]|uniref:DUF3078 domain-containing protein n=1 Tax=Mucilaginibacter sp. TaxID=1882438 RepID=UPI0026251429|nr:DUF3078 domain-containing protein [Mucilaginibacter sp.]
MAAFSASAQKTDSLKKDIKVDTAILNKYHIDPPKNSLPVRTRVQQIRQESIPVSMLDYKINYWKKWISMALNFNQSAFSKNYTSGGSNSIALGTNFDYKTEYKKGPLDYVGELNLIYGITKNKGQGSRKTQDRIFFDNKIATQLSKSWYFFGSLTFESQFDKGYIYNSNGTLSQISNFMAPGYLTESVGFEYKPSGVFDLRLGTGTARQTFVLDTGVYNKQKTAYGVDLGKKIKNDLAFQVVSTFIKEIAKGMPLNVRYALFIPYEKHVSYISHRVDATLGARVNRLVQVNLNGTFIYDKSTNPLPNTTKTFPQATEGMALGIVYKFPY